MPQAERRSCVYVISLIYRWMKRCSITIISSFCLTKKAVGTFVFYDELTIKRRNNNFASFVTFFIPYKF
jgi:hypothetical protein